MVLAEVKRLSVNVFARFEFAFEDFLSAKFYGDGLLQVHEFLAQIQRE